MEVPAQDKSLLVYVVEDEPVLAQYVSMALTPTGARCVGYCDGISGLQACLSFPPDLLIVDLGLPGLSGESVVRLLRASPIHRNVPILVVSAKPDARKAADEILHMGGAIGFLAKPFTDEELRCAVNRLARPWISDDPDCDQAVGGTGQPVSATSPIGWARAGDGEDDDAWDAIDDDEEEREARAASR